VHRSVRGSFLVLLLLRLGVSSFSWTEPGTGRENRVQYQARVSLEINSQLDLDTDTSVIDADDRNKNTCV